ncbi:hypothetical protein [Clostridium ljungdahlii]|nr:hypothetical protein [Clostridium ljungdahlii]
MIFTAGNKNYYVLFIMVSMDESINYVGLGIKSTDNILVISRYGK